MSHLCFGTFGTALKKAMLAPNGNVEVVTLLLSLITNQKPIYNKQSKKDAEAGKEKELFDVSDKIASNYLNCKVPVLSDIVTASSLETVTQNAAKYFEEEVIPNLEPMLLDNLLMDICSIFDNDKDVPDTWRSRWHVLVNEKKIPEFLALTFLYAIKKDNVIADSSEDIIFDESTAISDMDKVQELLKKYPHPKEIPVPDIPANEEMEYIEALLAVYAEELKYHGKPTLSMLESTKFEKDLRMRRKDYYSAESIREGTKDIFGDQDEQNFSKLKEDIYDGVYEEYLRDHSSSMERLLDVMKQASVTPVSHSVLLSKLDWVSAKEKKGVCHFLVKDGEISWVVDQ